MIVGLGLGMVETERFRAAEQRHGTRLLDRLFTPGERGLDASRPTPLESLAVRFAAKLAARRALALPGPCWRGLEITGGRGRAPSLVFHAEAARVAQERGVVRVSVSLSHDAKLCIAHVVLEDGS